jgi:alkaline phosphatase D
LRRMDGRFSSLASRDIDDDDDDDNINNNINTFRSTNDFQDDISPSRSTKTSSQEDNNINNNNDTTCGVDPEAVSQERDGILREGPPSEHHSRSSWSSCGPSFCIKILSVATLVLAMDVALLVGYIFTLHYQEPSMSTASSASLSSSSPPPSTVFLTSSPPSAITGSSSSSSSISSSSSTPWNITWAPLPPNTQVVQKVAFGSCSSQIMPQPYWDTLLLPFIQPDLVLLMGDNIYGDCTSMDCSELKQAYHDLASHASFKGAIEAQPEHLPLRPNLPIIATLDDHDYGKGDATSTNPYKDVAKQLFLDFYNIHDERRLDRPKDGVYQQFTFGPLGQQVQVIVLDTRYSRSEFLATKDKDSPYTPDYNDTTKQILSPTQWIWLEQVLGMGSGTANPPPPPPQVRLIVSSFQVLNTGTGFECWNMLPHELDRLKTLVASSSTKTKTLTIFLSGDRHVGGFYQSSSSSSLPSTAAAAAAAAAAIYYEVTASSWTHTTPYGAYHSTCTDAASCDEVSVERIGPLVRDNHFGMVEIDWLNRSVTVALRRAETTPYYTFFDTSKHKGHTTDAGQVIQAQTYEIPK